MKTVSIELPLKGNNLDWQRGRNDMSKETKKNEHVNGDRKEDLKL